MLGRGGAGKSTLAARLGAALDLPVVELDSVFWPPNLTPLPPAVWAACQERLIAPPTWILDGDLGPYDVLAPRLRAADTVVLLDFSMPRCAWRALRRGRETWPFWRWLLTYRRRSLPTVTAAIRTHAAGARVHVLRTPHAVAGFLAAQRIPDAGARSRRLIR